ncbi:MAG: polymer-forming cytoskeletal protein [Asticcacaulis sp.]
MFNKTPKAPAATAPAAFPSLDTQVAKEKKANGKAPAPMQDPSEPAVSGPALSEIGAHTVIDGHVSIGGDLQLDGTIRGNVRAKHLIIGESGCVDGQIEADSVEVRGRVSGAITAHRVTLLAGARVDGDITHTQLAIEMGAHYQGHCLPQKNEA